MFLLVQPLKGLPEPPQRATSRGEQLKMRLQFRGNELDRFWQRLSVELRLDADRRQRAEKRMQKLPGLGMLVIDDEVAPLDSLRRIDWLRVWPERRLPTPSPPMPTPAPPTPTPVQQFWHLGMIKKPAGLDGSKVTVGVIDFGYDPNYPGLGTFTPTYAEYVDPTSTTMGGMQMGGTPADPPYTNRHGSMVCAMLAGDSIGVAPKANYLVAAVASQVYSGTQIKMAMALEWLIAYPTGAHADRSIGCDIITTSVFTNYYGVNDVGSEIDAMLLQVEGWDTLVVAAVGNGGANNWQAPGCYERVLAVGSVDKNRNVTYFSAYGNPDPSINKPDLLAPGLDLEWPDGNNGVILGEGTSFSAPIVAGAAALILEKHPNHRFNVVNFRSAVTSLTSPSTSPGTLASGRGICDLSNL
jgi:serine protease AprX